MKSAIVIVLCVVAVGLIAGGFWLWTPDKSRADLEARYLKSPADMRDVGGVRLHVRDDGPKTAPAIIMLHGFGSSLHTWEPWAQALQSDYRVVRIDLPGSGLSPPDPIGRYDDARTMELLAALMDQMGIAKAALVGNSIGGRIAWNFAARNPDRVTKLVLISPDGFASQGFAYGQAPKVPSLVHVMRYVLPQAMLRKNLEAAYADPAVLSGETLDRYYDLMRAPDARAALIARMEQTVLQDPEPQLRLIKAPTLLLWGDNDKMIPVANAADYTRNMPDASLVRLPDLGHVPQEERPDLSLPPVVDFLRLP